MNQFEQAEAHCAKTIAEQTRELCRSIVKRYAKPEDQDAAAVALERAIVEQLKGESNEL